MGAAGKGEGEGERVKEGQSQQRPGDVLSCTSEKWLCLLGFFLFA